MSIKNKLQIYLVTYNRINKLRYTLDEILNSPIKDFDITVLDNASTDGTSELIEEYCKKYINLKHVRHNVNIGGNANICRAFEMGASCGKEYIWVLCDDDEFDFSNWKEIENALLSDNYDMTFTINHLGIRGLAPKLPVVLFWAAFVPGVIYKTKYIDETCIVNMYGTIATWYPHGAIAIDILVNNSGQYFIPSRNIVNRITIDELDGKVFHRGQKISREHPDLSRMYWHVGYMKALKLVRDKKIKQNLSAKVHFTQDFLQSDIEYLEFVLDYNQTYKNNNIDNYWDIFRSISFGLKIYMIYYLICGKIIKKIIQKIFSVRNEGAHKVLRIFGIKIKCRRK